MNIKRLAFDEVIRITKEVIKKVIREGKIEDVVKSKNKIIGQIMREYRGRVDIEDLRKAIDIVIHELQQNK